MRYTFLFLLLLLLSHLSVRAQNVINTDRPDQSDGTHIVEAKHIQVETGVLFSKVDQVTKSFDNVTLLRYGVSRIFEVRLLNDYSSITDSNSVSGLKPLTISFKNQLCRQNGLLPKITLVSYFHLPLTVSSAFSGDNLGYTFTLAARHDLTGKAKMYSNFGFSREQQSTKVSYNATLEVNYNFTNNLSSYIEYFGNYATHVEASNGLDAGIIFAVTNNFAIDFALGTPTFQRNSEFVAAGVSFRLPTTCHPKNNS